MKGDYIFSLIISKPSSFSLWLEILTTPPWGGEGGETLPWGGTGWVLVCKITDFLRDERIFRQKKHSAMPKSKNHAWKSIRNQRQFDDFSVNWLSLKYTFEEVFIFIYSKSLPIPLQIPCKSHFKKRIWNGFEAKEQRN